jgi:hypothetical protein
MRHLSRIDRLDIVEDPGGAALAVERRRHLESCEACRTNAAELRATLAQAQRDRGTEPSPLFWDHFAARVSEAIRDESPAPAGHAGLGWFGGLTTAWTVAALVVLLGMTTVVWRVTLHAPRRAGAPGVSTVELPAVEHLDSDQQWDEVRAAADGMQWDEAQDAGISARPGSAERVVLELTADERAELARLLEREMKRSGV